MAIFADQCVNRDTISALRENGFNVIAAAETNLSSASDSEIFGYAIKNKCLLLTFDRDFGNILRFDIKSSCGVAVICVEDMAKEEITHSALGLFKKFPPSHFKGRLFIVERDKIRIWPK